MPSYVRAVCKLPDGLSVEEQNLLSVAYKNAVGSIRAAWRIIKSVENKEKSVGNVERSKLLRCSALGRSKHDGKYYALKFMKKQELSS